MKNIIIGIQKGLGQGLMFVMILGLFFYVAKGEWDTTNPLKVSSGTEVLTIAKWNELVDKVDHKSWYFKSSSNISLPSTAGEVDRFTITLDKPGKVLVMINGFGLHPNLASNASYRCGLYYKILYNSSEVINTVFSTHSHNSFYTAGMNGAVILDMPAGNNDLILNGYRAGSTNNCTINDFSLTAIEL